MSKKLITACMALFALAAFALPATASATNDPQLTHPTGSLATVGSKIDATSIGIQKMTDTSGNTLVECASATMTGTLRVNSASTVEGDIETTSFSGTGTNGDCTSSFGGITVHTNIGANGTPWCLRSTKPMVTNEFQVRGGKCSAVAQPITFVLTSSIAGTCKYSRSEAIKGTFTTHPSDAVLTLTGAGATGGTDTEFTKEEGGIFCPSNGTLDMSFTLETDNAAKAEPTYIS
jgi:hypothetical protein